MYCKKGGPFSICTPLFRINGISAIVDAHFCLGGTVISESEFHPVRLWEVVERERITHLVSLPAMLGYMFPPR